MEVLDSQNNLVVQPFPGSADGKPIENLQPGTYTVDEIKHASNLNQLGASPSSQRQCVINQGFDDGGSLDL